NPTYKNGDAYVAQNMRGQQFRAVLSAAIVMVDVRTGRPIMKLMIVDDNAGMWQSIRQAVAAPGDVVCECASGDGAVRTVLQFKLDAVTMDVRMPGTSGFDAARAILTAQAS